MDRLSPAPATLPLSVDQMVLLLEQSLFLREFTLRLISTKAASQSTTQFRIGEEVFSLFPIFYLDRRSPELLPLLTSHYPVSVQLARLRDLPSGRVGIRLWAFSVASPEQRISYFNQNLPAALGFHIGSTANKPGSAGEKCVFLCSDHGTLEPDSAAAIEVLSHLELPTLWISLRSGKPPTVSGLSLRTLAQRVGFSTLSISGQSFSSTLKLIAHYLEAALSGRKSMLIEIETTCFGGSSANKDELENQLAADSILQYQNHLKELRLISDDRIRAMIERAASKAADLAAKLELENQVR